ncbi:MAG: F0F1 ATP synthase subunit B [Bacteroidia bacterium]
MELIKPGIGLIFWMTVSFGTVLFLLSKYAWKPIMLSLKAREESIQDALDAAKNAREEMKALTVDNERLINEAKVERDKILRQARESKEAIINDAKTRANVEADRLIAIAREAIENQKMAAITDLQNSVAAMSIEIAEKVLRHELANDEKQKALMNNLLSEISSN